MPRIANASLNKQFLWRGLAALARFVQRPLQTENLTSAVLFRVIEKGKPTLLPDEYDSWLRDDQQLRGLLNAGHRRDGQALRCEGDNHEVRAFRVFAPPVYAVSAHFREHFTTARDRRGRGEVLNGLHAASKNGHRRLNRADRAGKKAIPTSRFAYRLLRNCRAH
jgi:hypothetical protein